MSFLTTSLLAGATLIALPIAMHLIMRRKAQQLVFPALRFVRNRRTVNQTRMRLRHLLLLLLRCAAIALLAFALARPVWRASSGAGGATGGQGVAVVIDNSMRMTYRTENKTRLDEAKETADWVLGRLPADGRMVVADLSSTGSGRLVERDAALLRASRVRPSAKTRSIDQAVRTTLQALAEAEFQQQSVYVITDRTQGGLPDSTLSALAQAMEDYPQASLTFVDVGARRPVNVGLSGVELSASTLAAGQSLTVVARLSITGPPPGEPVSVELWLDGQGEDVKRGEQLIADAKDKQRVEFDLPKMTEGVHQGYVRILGSDPLPADDVQYFTVNVEAPRRLLIVSQPPANPVFVREALAPSLESGPQVYEIDEKKFTEQWQSGINHYRAVLLLDPPPLSPDSWRSLGNYTRQGGAVLAALGRAAAPGSFNSPDAQELLPGNLKWVSRDQTYLRPTTYTHPAIAQLAELADALPWSEFPVDAYWALDDLSPSTVVVSRYANGAPAILDRRVEEGRVLTVTTSFSDDTRLEKPWNLLPTGFDAWPFLALVDNLAAYLCGAAETRLNYTPGEIATLPIGDAESDAYVLRLPSGDAVRQTLPPGATEASVGMTEEPGNYRLQSGGERGGIDAGFSVSPSEAVGQLEPRPEDEVLTALPEDRVQFADGRQAIAARLTLAAEGRELYPWLITLVATAMAAELWVSNRFYEKAGGSKVWANANIDD